LCDIEPDSFEEDSRRTVCFFVLRISIWNSSWVVRAPKQTSISAICQQIAS
jgi:hypothetical protein